MSSQSGISKTKSSIFGGNKASSTATKSINGFGNSGANGGHPPQSSHYQHQQQASSSKGFCANKILKGSSFNQMSYIATPTSAIESSASKLIITSENGGSGNIGVHHERKVMKLGTQ